MSALGNFGPGPMLTPDLTQKVPATPEVTTDAAEVSSSSVVPATPEATEREAREVVRERMVDGPRRGPRHDPLCALVADLSAHKAECRDCDCGYYNHADGYLDAYRAAVAAVEYERGRRAERERIAGIVEGMRGMFEDGPNRDWVSRTALLDRLREGA